MRLSMPVISSLKPGRQPARIVNVAHRGASADVAENTLASIARAIVLGADVIELDVQRTKDGALVLMHDTTLTRTTNVQDVFPGRGPWRVGDFTYDELVRLDAGSWKSRGFAGERIPTLTDAIQVIRHSRAGLLVELKAPELYPGIVSDLVAALRDVPGFVDAAVTSGRVAVQSFNFAAMKDHKTQEPTIPVGLLGAPAWANLPALGSWADQVNPRHYSVDKAYVDEVHRLGMGCMVWTVNRAPAMKRALRIGADGVITNRPDVLDRVLGQAPAGTPSG